MLLRRSAWLCVSAVAVVGVVGCGGAGPSDERQTAVDIWSSCRVGGVGSARCARVSVPVDHDAPDGPRIELEVAVLPALAAKRSPDPFVIFAGGPGQAATEVGPALEPLLGEIRKTRDVLLVDQRGTGSSSPLDCDLDGGDRGRPTLARTFDTSPRLGEIQTCLKGYDVDPAHFATPAAVKDMEVVRNAAGYERLNLFGASYGTRAALAYARRHPDRVRTIVLDGMAPMNMALPVPMAADGQRSLDLASQACGDDEACRRRFGDLQHNVERLLASLETPRPVTVRHPTTGVDETFTIGRDAVGGVVRSALYTPETTALLPLVVDAALEGDFGPLAALAISGSGLGDTISMGMFFSVVCSEDHVFAQREALDVEAATAGAFNRDFLVRELWAACEFWPRASLPDDYFEPVTVDVPTLVLSGSFDPATPPRWGQAVADALPTARHVEVPGMAHGTWRSACVSNMIAEFVSGADLQTIDDGCIQDVARPPFFVSVAGPQASSEPSASGDRGAK